MIPYMRVSFYRLMQFTIAVIGIQFELLGFHSIGPTTKDTLVALHKQGKNR